MRQLWHLAALGGAALGLASCGGYDNEQAYDAGNETAYGAGEADANYGAGNASYETAATTLPEGSRVVIEDGVRYRIDPGGARIRIADDESVIVLEDGVRYRIDPGGTRVRVDLDDAEVRVGSEDINANVRLDDNPSVDVSTNRR